ncbi:MAG: DUF1501 domain-containing protein [Terriglobia bacterium]
MLIRSRRDFFRTALRSVAGLSSIGALSKFGEMNALAAGPGYQALVCIFLAGGNDGHNTVIPIQTAQQNFSAYQNARSFLTLPQATLPQIHNGSDVYGLHPRLTEIQALYNSNKAAVVANLGMLVKPLTRAVYLGNNSSILPNALFSHSDQTSQWQSSIPTGLGSTGWGGRLADAVQAMNTGALFPSVTSVSGSSLFCTGAQTLPATVPPGGSAQLSGTGNAARMQGLQQLLTFDNGLQLVQAANSIFSRGVAYANTLNGLLATSTLTTPFPANNPLAQQLQTVARIIKVQAQLGLSRQIFFCQLGGFDTHGGQLAIQDALLQQLSQAAGAFYQSTVELGMDQNVVTFTASEFGRTLTPNSDGTDHAWGNHHFVIGGAVKGGQFYGQYPSLALGGPNDANTRGTLIPTTSVDQYGATLAQWFGVSPGNLSGIFPNVGNFATPVLGVLG